MRENELDRNNLPFDVEKDIGKIERAVLECPGVYYLQIDWDRSSTGYGGQVPSGTEFYIVTDEATMISKEARQYGESVCDQPGLRLYSLENEKSGSHIIDYEINKYRFQNNLPLTPTETLMFLKLLTLKTYPIADGKRIYLILDNAPWHKKAVRLVQTEALPEYQDIRDKMTLLFLPPYSPDFNPIEQVWRITRREVTHNTYFAIKNQKNLPKLYSCRVDTYRRRMVRYH